MDDQVVVSHLLTKLREDLVAARTQTIQVKASCKRPKSVMSCRAAASSGATLAAWRRAPA